MRCSPSPAPQEFTEGRALWAPYIQQHLGDRLGNPQCHCSHTTVEIEVSKCTPQWHEDSFPWGAAVVLETLLQVYGRTRRDCELIPLSPAFNYPYARGFRILLYTTLGWDWGQAMEKGDKLILMKSSVMRENMNTAKPVCCTVDYGLVAVADG